LNNDGETNCTENNRVSKTILDEPSTKDDEFSQFDSNDCLIDHTIPVKLYDKDGCQYPITDGEAIDTFNDAKDTHLADHAIPTSLYLDDHCQRTPTGNETIDTLSNAKDEPCQRPPNREDTINTLTNDEGDKKSPLGSHECSLESDKYPDISEDPNATLIHIANGITSHSTLQDPHFKDETTWLLLHPMLLDPEEKKDLKHKGSDNIHVRMIESLAES
jgi:hypothetical protein